MASEHVLAWSDGKITVQAIDSITGTGIYDERDKLITVPSYADMMELIPYKWRKALARQGANFWYESTANIDLSGRLNGRCYLTLRNYRNKPMATIYIIR